MAIVKPKGKTLEWKKFDIMSVAKIQAVIMAICGFIAGIIMAAIGESAMLLTGVSGGAGLGIAAIVIFPITYAILGFVGGAIGAFIYNIVADKIGGVVVYT